MEDFGFVEPELDELQKPTEWIPSWFKLSPSMLTYSFDQCGQKFIYKYMHRMTQKDVAPSLARTMAFRFAIFNWKNYYREGDDSVGMPGGIGPAIEEAIKEYFMTIACAVAEKMKIDPPDDAEGMEQLLSGYYKWVQKKIPSLKVLMNQCYSSAKEVIDYMMDIEVALDPEMRFNTPISQKHMLADYVNNGEILDETFGRPTQFQVTLQFLSSDFTIYLFKISDSQIYIPNLACYNTDEAGMMAAALQQWWKKASGEWMSGFKVVILRAVVNNGGGCKNLEEHERYVDSTDITEALEKGADAAKDIKSVRLHRKRQLSCAWCEMRDPCLFGKTSGYQIPASEALHDRDIEGRFDDDDDLPY